MRKGAAYNVHVQPPAPEVGGGCGLQLWLLDNGVRRSGGGQRRKPIRAPSQADPRHAHPGKFVKVSPIHKQGQGGEMGGRGTHPGIISHRMSSGSPAVAQCGLPESSAAGGGDTIDSSGRSDQKETPTL